MQDSGPLVHVQVFESGELVTVYPMIGLAPLSEGATHETVADALPRVAATPVGAAGGASGVTGVEGAEGSPVPIRLVAVTVNV